MTVGDVYNVWSSMTFNASYDVMCNVYFVMCIVGYPSRSSRYVSVEEEE